MRIDFGKLGGANSADTVLNPREIFSVLPEKDPRYNYPRDVQSAVWDKWFEVRDREYNVIKMNTGSGKTVVGLLMLKSCLNEGKGPGVYVVPDPYLVSQVIEEALRLGIETTQNEDSPRYRRGQAILVINIYKLFNGRSRFGVNDQRIPIGSIIIDDAHACLDITESQFTMEIPISSDYYSKLFNIFKESLRSQSETTYMELELQVPYINMLVPYWSWIDNIREVSTILLEAYRKNDEEREESLRSVGFSYRLIKDCLPLCNCVFGADKIEISPKAIPIHVIPSYLNSKRKIFMSATLADDSVLVSHFNVKREEVETCITPDMSDDIGDRMILVPQELNPDLKDNDIKEFLKEQSLSRNVVVIVPSFYRASFWDDSADLIISADNLYEGVTRLKSGHVGLVIMINKYDGIDLAKEACEILVIDGLPDVRRKIDKIEQGMLHGSDEVLSQIIQRIEQGMGRGIRSRDDHCVIFLMGSTLINHLFVNGANNKFTQATKAQMILSDQLSSQIRGLDITELKDVINLNLERKTEWVTKSKGILVHLKYKSIMDLNPVIIKQREAFNSALIKDYGMAVDLINDVVNETSDTQLKGYLKQQLAEYLYFTNPEESHVTLKSAVRDNHLVLHPLEGITYAKLKKHTGSQALHCSNYLSEKFTSTNKFIIAVNRLLEQLVFKPETANIFEQAFKDIAFYLGFSAQRPEAEYKKGPDVLWEVGNLKYFVIECKNGATNPTINKHDCNQLNGSINWFEEKYDGSCTQNAILVHPFTTFEYAASPNPIIRIMNAEKLELFREKFSSFAKAMAAHGTLADTKKTGELLAACGLKMESFIEQFTVNYSIQTRPGGR